MMKMMTMTMNMMIGWGLGDTYMNNTLCRVYKLFRGVEGKEGNIPRLLR